MKRKSFLCETTAVSFFFVIFRLRKRGPTLSGLVKISSVPSYSKQELIEEDVLIFLVGLLVSSDGPDVDFLAPVLLMAERSRRILKVAKLNSLEETLKPLLKNQIRMHQT